MLDKEFPMTHPTFMSRDLRSAATSTSEGDVLYRFGPFQLDPSERSLMRDQESILLTPKAFDTLCVLVENSGRLVTKDQLLDKVWPETYVEEKTLAQNIFTLRKALGTDPQGRNYIETVPKQGYRFSVNAFKFPRHSEEVISRREQQTEFTIEEEVDSESPETFSASTSHSGLNRIPYVIDSGPIHSPGRLRSLFSARNLLLSALVVTATGGLLIVVKFRKFWSRPPSFSKVKITQLTNTGDVGHMALSPDGKYVVYVKRGPGQQALVLRQTGSTSLIEIVPPQRTGYLGVGFSPDGNSVYYVVRPYGGNVASVYRIPLLGGTPVKVIEDADSPVGVSPDGKRIAFIRNVPSKNQHQLIIASTSGQDERVLASTSSELNFAFQAPAWSPDSKLIAVATVRPRSQLAGDGLALVDTENGFIRPFGKGDWKWVGQVAWLASGDGLVVTAAAASDHALSDQVWIFNYPSGEPRQVTNDVNGHYGVAVSNNESVMATVVSNRSAAFWISDPNNVHNAKQITRISGDRIAQSLGLSWTPDNRLLYSSLASGAAEVWTMNSDGSEQRQITADGGPNTMPLATPDGKYIVYVSLRSGERRIWRMQADGANAQELTKEGTIGLSITPDSKWIVYSALRDRRPTLIKVSIDGGEPIKLSQVVATFPSVSPDGKYVACYVITPDRKRRLSLVSFETGEIVKQFDVFQEYDLPSIRWTPDGKALTYVVSRTGVSNIWRQQISEGPPEQFTKWDSEVIFRFDWSRNGQLAVERGFFTNDIILIRAED